MKNRFHVLLALLLTAAAGCDFAAVEDAVDNFDIIIQLEPINTVIVGIIEDNATGELVDAQLEFSGAGAGMLIDAYSDPISSLATDGGLVTFGLQNAVVPTESSPVFVTVTARADGYFTTSETVELTEVGEGQFTIAMSSTNINTQARGTSSTQSSAASAGSNGQITQTVTIQTPPNQQAASKASVTLPQGVTPTTVSGTALTGQISTEIRSYDSGAGLRALPRAARQRSDGTNQAVGGAVFFKMTDSAGNVAAGATAASSGIQASKSAGVCTGGIQFTLSSTDSALRAAFDAASGTLNAEAWAYTPADGKNRRVVNSVPVEADDVSGVKVDLCLGGPDGSPGLISRPADFNPSQGVIYTFAFDASSTNNGPLANQVTLSGFSGNSVQFILSGPGINRTASVGLTDGTYSLSDILGTSANFDVVRVGTYVLSVREPGSTTVTSTELNPLSGSSSLTLPASSDLVNFDITASLSCDDPSTQKFEVEIDASSFDALSAFYRINGSGDSWTLLPKSAQTQDPVVNDYSIKLVGKLRLKPSTTYRFKGVLGNNSASETKETPAAGGPWTIDLKTSEVGITCKAR